MNDDVTVMDFTGVYERETFYKSERFRWIDCTDIEGDDCYCDSEALGQIRLLIKDFTAEGIHFIDSGNFHYLSKLWTDKIAEPFDLVLFDHHPDMQPSLFENLLSCGCWVKSVLDTNVFVNKVIIVGANERLLDGVEERYRERVVFYGEQSLDHEELWKRFAFAHLHLPVYISVDKDVLDTESAATNWDQGSLSLKDLQELLGIILRREEVIGVDICGECTDTLNIIEQEKMLEINDRTNRSLIHFLRKNAL